MNVEFWLSVNLNDGDEFGSVEIACGTEHPPNDALFIAAQHLMSLAAFHSDAGFNRTIQLLAEGAIKNHGGINQSQGEA